MARRSDSDGKRLFGSIATENRKGGIPPDVGKYLGIFPDYEVSRAGGNCVSSETSTGFAEVGFLE